MEGNSERARRRKEKSAKGSGSAQESSECI
jgi:hypothetical protein